jgi:hypothetical protein
MKIQRNLIGVKLQKIRLEKGISQSELIKACSYRPKKKISRNIIAKIEWRSRPAGCLNVPLKLNFGIRPINLIYHDGRHSQAAHAGTPFPAFSFNSLRWQGL